MEIIDLAWNENTSKRFSNPLFPRGVRIRGLIIGKSGCGKRNLLLNFLLRDGWLDYDNLYIFGKSLFQPEYVILKKAYEEQLPKDLLLRLFDNQNKIIQVKILNINSILVNIVSYVNGIEKPIIYSFFPNVSPGYKIIETPPSVVYLPITLDAIYSMETTLTDQNGRELNLRGENITIRFHVRAV